MRTINITAYYHSLNILLTPCPFAIWVKRRKLNMKISFSRSIESRRCPTRSEPQDIHGPTLRSQEEGGEEARRAKRHHSSPRMSFFKQKRFYFCCRTSTSGKKCFCYNMQVKWKK